MSEPTCTICGDERYVYPLSDLLARPEKDQRKYERRLSRSRYPCPVCNPSPEFAEPALSPSPASGKEG